MLCHSRQQISHFQIAQHKEQLARLKETQKEFMQFLEDENADELRFGQEELPNHSEDEEVETEAPVEDNPDQIVLTAELFEKWKAGAPTQV